MGGVEVLMTDPVCVREREVRKELRKRVCVRVAVEYVDDGSLVNFRSLSLRLL